MKAHTRIVADLIRQYANTGIGAEIGVYQGDTSRHILSATDTRMLFMVDQYVSDYDTTQWMYSTKHDVHGNPDADYEKVRDFFHEQFPNRHTLIRQSSEAAALEFDVELDFVFVDANHTYEHVLADLQLWIPKVRHGGLVMGHDWWTKFPGVITAVTEYARSTNHFTMPENPAPAVKLPKNSRYVPAPSKDPVVIKSWPAGHVWWALKNG
jgi:hypothetical protein